MIGPLLATTLAAAAIAATPTCPRELLTCGVSPPAGVDLDGDGFSAAQGDCDDTAAGRSPGQLERCENFIDDDCDAAVDETGCAAMTVVTLTDFSAPVVRQVSADLAWTAVATPPPNGTLRYDLRQSAAAFDGANWDAATPLAGTPWPGPAGQAETYTMVGLSPAATVYVALRLVDGNGQVYAQSSTIAVTTLGVEQPTPDGAGTAGDTVPPPPVTDLYAVPGYTEIGLRWTWPQNSDAVRVTVVRQAGAAPAHPADGDLVFSGLAETATDSAVQPGQIYEYAAYTFDHSGNVSPPARVTAQVLEPPGDGSVVADPAGSLYLVEGGELLAIPPALSLNALGLDTQLIILLPAVVIQRYPHGATLTASAAELLRRLDPDHDQLSNFDELGHATNPGDPDTDFDSYFDGVEVAAGHDPLVVPLTRRPDRTLMRRLAGRILLQAERQGQAWWVHPATLERYYLRDGRVAYQIMRFLSLGITNADLARIPRAGVDETGDAGLVKKLSGQMLLATEDLGKVWYLNPADGRRYYLRDGDAAYWMMRYRSLGITNANIDKIPIGTLRGKLK